MDELVAIVRASIEEMAKTEDGKKLLLQIASRNYNDGASMIDQLPEEVAERFVKTLSDVYGTLIKPDGKESQGS